MVKFLCLLLCLLAGNLAQEALSEPVELVLSPRRRVTSSPRRRISHFSSETRRRLSPSRHDTVRERHISRKPGAADEVKNAFTQVCIGFLLVIFAFPCLYYNEKRQVHMEKIFAWAEPRIKDVSADTVDAENEASIICVRGDSSTEETLRDSELDVTVNNCSKLKRSVQMYQWIEHKREETRDIGNGNQETEVTYTYTTDWRSEQINSNAFNSPGGHENPSFPLSDNEWTAKDVKLGKFQLDSELISQMSDWSPADINEQEVGGRVCQARGNGVIQSGGGGVEVGDLRITVQKVQCGTCTVASLQSGETFQPLTYALVPSGCCKLPDKVDFSTEQLNPGGGDVEIKGACTCLGAVIQSGECIHNLYESNITGKEVIDRMKKNQQCAHVALQLCGFIMFLIGNYWIFKFGGSFFNFIPWIGSWIDAAWKALAFMAACMCACQCWLITVAVSWLALRPLKGILLLVVAVALFVAINFKVSEGVESPANSTLI